MRYDKNSLPPSWFVMATRRYKRWGQVCVCFGCSLSAAYEDMHPVEPCLRCGNSVTRLAGRWAVVREEPVVWFGVRMPFNRKVWGWELLSPPNPVLYKGKYSVGRV